MSQYSTVGARLSLIQKTHKGIPHYGDVIMDKIAFQITSLTIVCSIVYSDADQRKRQSSASLAFVWGNHRGPVNSPHKWPVTRKMFPFDDVIMRCVVNYGIDTHYQPTSQYLASSIILQIQFDIKILVYMSVLACVEYHLGEITTNFHPIECLSKSEPRQRNRITMIVALKIWIFR